MLLVICSFWPEIGTFWPGMKKRYSTWMPKRSCSQMGHGQKIDIVYLKTKSGQYKRIWVQMGYGQK